MSDSALQHPGPIQFFPSDDSANAGNWPFGVCIRDSELRVVFQNESCVDTCGPWVGSTCRLNAATACERCSAKGPLAEGTFRVINQKIKGREHDVILINDGAKLYTLLYPLDRKYQNEFEFLRPYITNQREMEIVALLVQRKTKGQIAATLGIKENTVKTHIRRIYRRLPENCRGMLHELRSSVRNEA